ncbi:MFS transporter [Nocardia goodfellowii]
MSRAFIAKVTVATVGAFMSYVSVLSYSLALRIDDLAPGHEEYLGYITGAGGLVALVSTPLAGVFSDRCRSRYGRRRPFLIGGLLVGSAALLVIGTAPNLPILAAGWLLAVFGWAAVAMSAIMGLVADKVPEQQRGRVSGLTGFAQLASPVLGIGIASLASSNNLLLVLAPAVVGAGLIMPLALRPEEGDASVHGRSDRLEFSALLGKFVFDPRRYPDFSWNWLGRFLFFVGLTFNTTFTTFLFAQRMGVEVDEVGMVVAATAGGGLVATTLGALGGGFLSDRIRRRRVFVLLSGIVFASGAVVMTLSGGVVGLVAGAVISNVGMGAFSAVDQAVMLDVLPDLGEAGRFIGIMNYATQIPHAIAPLAATVLLAIGGTEQKNYSALYLAGGVLTVLGGLLIHSRVKGSR